MTFFTIAANILRLLWPFLKEIIFGKERITDNLRRNWVQWTMFAVNVIMFAMMVFLADQVLQQIRMVNQKKKENAVLVAKLNAIALKGTDLTKARELADKVKQLQTANALLSKQLEAADHAYGKVPTPQATHVGRHTPRVVTTLKRKPVPTPLTDTSLRDKLKQLGD